MESLLESEYEKVNRQYCSFFKQWKKFREIPRDALIIFLWILEYVFQCYSQQKIKLKENFQQIKIEIFICYLLRAFRVFIGFGF